MILLNTESTATEIPYHNIIDHTSTVQVQVLYKFLYLYREVRTLSPKFDHTVYSRNELVKSLR